ncbi:MAG: hypothetical protein J6035_01245 [Bacteroidaceae bacterium]|nr:hypothetical protein [Bacteroidaceae bacterium]
MKKNVLLLMTFALMSAINVLADGQQIPNGDFETWTYDGENLPNNWNSFQTADGSYASAVKNNGQVKRSSDVRPGSKGSYSCSIWAKKVWGTVAQGNLTTGRVHAGSMSATGKDNYNYTDRTGASSANGKVNEPCAVSFTGTPKAVKVWVKFVPVDDISNYGEYNKAKFSAIIHGDGDYISYGLSSNDNDDNKALVVATAVKEIEYKNGEWEELTIPFEYTNNGSVAKYIQINASTNAYPGKGKANDYLYIDDIELVYDEVEAKVFTNDPLYVTVNGDKSGPYEATVYVTENDDNTINFMLKNFVLNAVDEVTGDVNEMPVGNINVMNIPVTKGDGKTSFTANQIIEIEEGDDPNYDFWMGPMLGEIPLAMSGQYNDEHLYVTIDIPLGDEMQVYVELGEAEKEPIIFDQDQIYVTVNGDKSGPYDATVYVTENDDNTINFMLKNFVLNAVDEVTGDVNEMPVGNINVTNIPTTSEGEGVTGFAANQVIEIEEGDDPNYDFWMGPMLGEVPLEMSGKYNNEHLYVVIDIPLSDDMQVYVELGKSDLTAVKSVKVVKKVQTTGKIYDLNGREVKAMQSGQIYVVDGVKVAK